MTVHHRIDGTGAGLLLVNSLGAALELWEPQVGGLAARHRLVRFDQRGHGGTPAPEGPYTIEELAGDALELVDGLGLERVSICGLSIGGAVATWIAANARERVDRLVIASAGTRFATPEMWQERAAAVREGGTEAVADAVLSRWFTPAFAAARPDVVAGLRATFCAVQREGYAGCCEALADLDLRDRLAAIGAPTLVVTGEGDPVAPPETGEQLAASISGARHVTVAGARHITNAEQPSTFSQHVLAHLTEENP